MGKLRTIAILTSALGIVDSIYLLLIKVLNNKSFCIQGVGDCWSVNTSRYSEINGIPVSAIGILGYATILLLWFFLPRTAFTRKYIPLINFMFSLIGVIYSAYLTYLEIAVIKAICPFCVVSALLMAVLFIVSLLHLFKSPENE